MKQFVKINFLIIRTMEGVYKQLVQEKLSVFTMQTSISTITSLLIQKRLMSNDESASMGGKTDKSQAVCFYVNILPSKGDGAYTLLRQCIKEETEHRGHECLNDLFVEAESKFLD